MVRRSEGAVGDTGALGAQDDVPLAVREVDLDLLRAR
jgi:hypothetical protein